MLLVFSWMEFDTERSLPISETSDNFTSLSVPKLNDLVKRSTEELLSIIGKLNITHCFSMAHVRSQTLSVGQYIPDFNCTIVTCTEKKVAEFREELNTLDSFIVAIPGVNPLLGKEGLVLLGPEVRRRLNKTLIATSELIS